MAAIWRRPVIGIEEGGAALGAAAAAAAVFLRAEYDAKLSGRAAFISVEGPEEMAAYSAGLLKSKEPVLPLAEDVKAFHDAGGYIRKFAEAELKLLIK